MSRVPYEARHFTGADVDDITPEEEAREDLVYECPECLEKWATPGWLPPDYYDEQPGRFAAVACIDSAGDVFCEWCEVEGRPVL